VEGGVGATMGRCLVTILKMASNFNNDFEEILRQIKRFKKNQAQK
jgi:hypothetical protein